MNKNPRYKEVLKRLRKNAEISRKRGPYSVVNKHEVAPSGDKHDYFSYARYWWPNPDTPDGLPYIRRDGKTNKDLLDKGDRETIGMLYDDLETLALAGYLLNDEASAKHAALLAPHVVSRSGDENESAYTLWPGGPRSQRRARLGHYRHAPFHPRLRFRRTIERNRCIGRIQIRPALIAWMKQYLDWLRNDPMGKDESSEKNNHGTWYDAQVAAIAMFVGERETARQIVENAKVEANRHLHRARWRAARGARAHQGAALLCFQHVGDVRARANWRAARCRSLELRVRRRSQLAPRARLRSAVSDVGRKNGRTNRLKKCTFRRRMWACFLWRPAATTIHDICESIDKELRDPEKFQYGPLLFPAELNGPRRRSWQQIRSQAG